MTIDLATITPAAVTETERFRAYLEQKREVIANHLAPGCPPQELEFFLEQCSRLQLDPILKQVYFIKRTAKQGDRWVDRWTMQVGIDGFRAVADRTGLYVGSDDAAFEHDHATGRPTKATVTVWKWVQGQRCPFTASARWDEYLPPEKQRHMWEKMPHVMLGKVAEALALRKAFPHQLGGVYIPEEMDQGARPERPPEQRVYEGEIVTLERGPTPPMPASTMQATRVNGIECTCDISAADCALHGEQNQQLADLKEAIEQAGDLDKLAEVWFAIKELKASQAITREQMTELAAFKDARKAILQAEAAGL